MPNFNPIVAPEIFALRPDFRALSIRASEVENTNATPMTEAILARACRERCVEQWADAHLNAWREAYRSFDAKPQRTPCSAEALLKRAERDGSLPSVNAVVDLYNAVSLNHAVPVGGENVTAYIGPPQLVRASGSEPFETMQSGNPATETPEPGEVIWRDEHGVTCRRWNWRQGTRTRIEVATREMWFVLEALDPMPGTALMRAGSDLVRGLRSLSPGCDFESCLITKAGTTDLAARDFA